VYFTFISTISDAVGNACRAGMELRELESIYVDLSAPLYQPQGFWARRKYGKFSACLPNIYKTFISKRSARHFGNFIAGNDAVRPVQNTAATALR
jgi:hypothetical protein